MKSAIKEVKSPTKLHWFFITVLILGIFLRFYNLGGQVYWHDEAYTSLRISGYTSEEVKQEVFTGKVIQVKDLDKYQRSHGDRNLFHVIDSLALDDAQHPPFYYILVKIWADIFGSSIISLRSFSVFISLLIFPCLYGLCRELFSSSLVGWMAIAIAAVSPYSVIYAREAREYSLWMVLILLTSVLLLRAIRHTHNAVNPLENLKNWGGYAIALTIALYTFPLSGIIAIGHGLYLFISEQFTRKFGLTKSISLYSSAVLLSLLAFSPWLKIILATWSKTGATWTAIPLPFPIWLKLWGLHFSRAFVFTSHELGIDPLLHYIILPLFLLLILSAFYFLCRTTPLRVWLFVLSLTITLPLFLALPDLILGGQRSTSSRYLVPLYLGIQIAIAYLLATQIHQPRWWLNRLWKSVTLCMITLGLISCLFYVNSETSWNKVVSFNNPKILQAIAQSENSLENSLLITVSFGINFGNILSLSHTLDPNLNLLLIQNSDRLEGEIIPDIPAKFTNLYFLNIRDRFRQTLETQYNLKTELIYHDLHLWLWKNI